MDVMSYLKLYLKKTPKEIKLLVILQKMPALAWDLSTQLQSPKNRLAS